MNNIMKTKEYRRQIKDKVVENIQIGLIYASIFHYEQLKKHFLNHPLKSYQITAANLARNEHPLKLTDKEQIREAANR